MRAVPYYTVLRLGSPRGVGVHDEDSGSRLHLVSFCLGMILSENRCPLFGIMS